MNYDSTKGDCPRCVAIPPKAKGTGHGGWRPAATGLAANSATGGELVTRTGRLIGRLSRRMAAQPGMAPKASPSLTSPASNADSCRTMAHDRG